jgi:hypothetical protein
VDLSHVVAKHTVLVRKAGDYTEAPKKTTKRMGEREAKMPNKKQTSGRVASEASDLLRTSKNKEVKSVAGSDLAQARRKPKKQ